MAKISFKDHFKDHMRDNALRYYLLLFVCVCSIVIGIYLSITGFSYSNLLTGFDKNMYAYISGTAGYTEIFKARLLNMFICVILLFAFNIVWQTAFLNYFYLAYQMTLIVLSSSAVISLYGFTGIINVVLFVIPINLVNFAILSFLSVSSMERASYARHYQLGFTSSIKETSYLKKFAMSVLLLFAFCLVYSFVLPLIFKSFVVINY